MVVPSGHDCQMESGKSHLIISVLPWHPKVFFLLLLSICCPQNEVVFTTGRDFLLASTFLTNSFCFFFVFFADKSRASQRWIRTQDNYLENGSNKWVLQVHDISVDVSCFDEQGSNVVTIYT
jgi:hypothetical protein